MQLSLAGYGQGGGGGHHHAHIRNDNTGSEVAASNRGHERRREAQPQSSDAAASTTQTAAPERLKASSRTVTNTSDLQFQVKTAEGDTVTLSINAVQQSTRDRVSYEGGGNTLQAGQQTQASSLSASLQVDGDLSEQELKDITSVLTSLSQGKQPTELGTVQSAQLSYTNQTTYSQSKLSYLG